MFKIRLRGSEPSTNNIMDDMKSLKPLETMSPPKFKEPKKEKERQSLLELSSVSLSDKLKEKKDKKGKKKSKWADIFSKYNPSTDNTTVDVSEVSLDEYVTMLERRNSDDYTDDDIVDEQRRGYDKLKRDDNIYKKEFAEELTLLYNLLNESTNFGKKLDRKFDSMENSKVRGTTKYSTDLAMSIISIKGNKLSILKEIASIKKIIADLKFKETKSKDEGAYSMDRLASSYLKGVMSQGRGDFVKNMGHGGFDDYGDRKEHITSSYLNEYEREDVDDIIANRLRNEGNPFRSEEGTLNIEMEKLGIKTMIKRNVESGEWYFINVDKDGNRVDGYPVPSTDRRIKWNDDNGTATDEWNGIYKVMNVYDSLY